MAELQDPADARVVAVSREALPLACPGDDRTLWSMHPRVWLPLGQVSEVTCPYCSTKYRLED